MSGIRLPLRRESDLLVEELDGELLVLAARSRKALRLDRVAARIWQACNGRRTADDIAERVLRETEVPLDPDVVRHTVARLAAADLLDLGESPEPGLSRRQLLRRGALAASIPAIAALEVPAAQAMASTTCVHVSVCRDYPGYPCYHGQIDDLDKNCNQCCNKDTDMADCNSDHCPEDFF